MDGLANDINVVQVFVMIFVKSRTADDLFVVAAAKQRSEFDVLRNLSLSGGGGG
jgi:hypothetical protein